LVDRIAADAAKGKKFNFEALSEAEQDIIVQGYPFRGAEPDWNKLTLRDLQAVGSPQKIGKELKPSLLDQEMNREYAAYERAVENLRYSRRPLYDKLRSASPSVRLRDRVISRAKGLDEVSKLAPPSKGLDVDHIVPLKQIMEMPGFMDLDWLDQVAIVNYERNLKAVDLSANRSRGELSWSDLSWSQRAQYTTDALKEIMTEEQALITELQKEIEKIEKRRPKR